MFITISDISKRLYPLDYIDNRSGNLRIGLRRITFCLDWWNTSKGFVNIEDVLEEYQEMDNVVAEFNEKTGIMKLTPGESNSSTVIRDPEVLELLKIKLNKRGTNARCTLDKPCESRTAVDFMPVKLLNVHCNQVDSRDNFFDTSPSTLLTTVAIGNHVFGDVVTHDFFNPEYKRLKPGALTDLKIDIFDQSDNEIIHHSEVPVSCTLEIIP